LEDTYLRLDRDIAALLKFLDEWTGNNYLLFFTADHGAGNNAEYAKDKRQLGGKFEGRPLSDSLKNYIRRIYGTDSIVTNVSANNIILNRDYIELKKMNLQEIQEKCA